MACILLPVPDISTTIRFISESRRPECRLARHRHGIGNTTNFPGIFASVGQYLNGFIGVFLRYRNNHTHATVKGAVHFFHADVAVVF